MFILSQTKMVEEKVNRLIQGYSAYSESEAVIRLIKREIHRLQIPVIIDHAENGCWFIPDQPEQLVK
ncbi:hypothetical protein [Radiobacillus sp. PE A8.2]|uniref:hypothetical protein n=1 Tax=Radiobacillus sp. PE A8.2 TaxID=3380349 RepID=UPI00388EE95D